MLEIIRDRAQGLIVKIILGLITIPFALWGVDSYIRGGDKADIVAQVDGQNISGQEFSRALKEQQGRMRGAMGERFDPAILDRPEVRQSVLDELVQQRLLAMEANRVGFKLPDTLLASIIADIPEFQQDGKFSQSRYESMTRAQDMTPAVFESRLRQNLVIQQLFEGLSHGVAVPHASEEMVVRLAEQQREISQAMLVPEQYMIQLKVDPPAVKAYYDKHREEFLVPEQVRLDYVVLSADEMQQQMAVSEEEVKKYYDEHSAQYHEPEQRRASHILIAERSQAEQMLKEIKQNPTKFEEIAKQHSKDPGSAAKGGDLGFFARGAMVKPFEDAAFGMKDGEISALVQSNFGFHIIKLTAIRGGGARGFDEVRGEIAQELKKQKAVKKFAELAETFSNTVYEQPDSLKPVADALKLKIQSSPWISKKGGGMTPLNHPKLLQTVFSEDALKLKRNTEAVEVAPNTLVAARVAEYKAASYKPFEELNTELAKRLLREQGNAMAVKQGKDALASLQKGDAVADLKWGATILISRENASSMGRDVLNQIFRTDAGKLPAYTGIENAKGGYTLIKVSKVVEPGAIDPAKKKSYANPLRQALAQEYSSAYLASLKQKADISIRKEKLEKVEH
ncbi:MAG: peptidylprolyl isomerase [Hydrogenophilales bacterium CG_4_9_14_3_um_filter_59_35]|nr:MAG: peptidylprolyl isomerase [Hydrogenophilales bacterium CG18_big_fil_WC_8_21_14_2_50_58_12]PIX98854.1 MAG: peptidylprolyl isomerase [Hydrogenophilales bacterium CG_4_10_14_3_um_filter_58_23]PJB08181.1 MAG: peptidylprolyl isomerase [Hydrogenophilales bacterium CG_4_9_14_3_um_filter_59_35]